LKIAAAGGAKVSKVLEAHGETYPRMEAIDAAENGLQIGARVNRSFATKKARSEGCGPKKKPRQNRGGTSISVRGGKAYLLVAQCNTLLLRFAQGKSSLLARAKKRPRRGRGHVSQALILKRASASRPSGQWNDDDFDVLADGVVVERIFKANAAPVGTPWMWTLAFRPP
jgi:hypothetical protein